VDNNYNNLIREEKKYLEAISVTIREVLDMSVTPKNKPILKRQSSLFSKLRNNDNYEKYIKKTYNNLEKLTEKNTRIFVWKIKEKVTEVLEKKHYSKEVIDRICSKLEGD